MNKREEVASIIKKLKKTMTLEEIAVKMDVSFPTVYAWGRGARKPNSITRKALVTLLEGGKV